MLASKGTGEIQTGHSRSKRLGSRPDSANNAFQSGAENAAAAGATTFGKHFAKGGEIGRIKADIGGAAATAVAAPIRVVPHVVGFGAELEANAFVDRDGFE